MYKREGQLTKPEGNNQNDEARILQCHHLYEQRIR